VLQTRLNKHIDFWLKTGVANSVGSFWDTNHVGQLSLPFFLHEDNVFETVCEELYPDGSRSIFGQIRQESPWIILSYLPLLCKLSK